MTLWADNTEQIARAGMLARSLGAELISKIAEGAITAGLVVQIGTSDKQVKPIAALPSADVDSLVETPKAMATSEVIVSGADLDGAIGTGLIIPAQRITVALNSHADWDLTTGELFGERPDGVEFQEQLAIPDAGDVTLTTVQVYSRLNKLVIPAQSGSAATLTAGTDPDEYQLDRRAFPGIAVYDRMLEPSATATVEFDDEEPLAVLVKGCAWVIPEAAVSPGDPVWVRMVESGTDLRGQMRGDYAANFARLPNAHFLTTAAADGFAIVELA